MGSSDIVRVETVYDGNVFGWSPEDRVRLVDVCAPAGGDPGSQLGTRRLSRLVWHKEVRLERRGNDDDGRVLADVYVDGAHVNAKMRDYGYGCG